MIPHRHQQLLVTFWTWKMLTVEDIMVPRNEIVGIDFDDDWDRIVRSAASEPSTHALPERRGNRPHRRRPSMKQVVHLTGARPGLTATRLIESGRWPAGLFSRAVCTTSTTHC